MLMHVQLRHTPRSLVYRSPLPVVTIVEDVRHLVPHVTCKVYVHHKLLCCCSASLSATPDGVCWCMQTVDDVHAWLQSSDDAVLLSSPSAVPACSTDITWMARLENPQLSSTSASVQHTDHGAKVPDAPQLTCVKRQSHSKHRPQVQMNDKLLHRKQSLCSEFTADLHGVFNLPKRDPRVQPNLRTLDSQAGRLVHGPQAHHGQVWLLALRIYSVCFMQMPHKKHNELQSPCLLYRMLHISKATKICMQHLAQLNGANSVVCMTQCLTYYVGSDRSAGLACHEPEA